MDAVPRRGGAGATKGVAALSRSECLSLLSSHHFGRVAVALPGGAPVIRPVNYVFDPVSQSVVLRTSRGSKLHALLAAATAAFEIDGSDECSETGWSVIIAGSVEPVSPPAEIAHLERLGFRTWAPGPRPHWMRIRAVRVSGRRICAPAHAPAGVYLG